MPHGFLLGRGGRGRTGSRRAVFGGFSASHACGESDGPTLPAAAICSDRGPLVDLAGQPGLAPLADVLQLNDGGLQLDPNQWRRTWFKGGVRSGVLASPYLATTQTGRSYVVAAVAQNPAPPIPEGADLSMLAAIRGAFTLAAQS